MGLSAGSRLGPYEILAPLGAGGMGEVYRARDTRLGREVAVKVLPANLSNDPNALARFENEARAVAALSHPNILALFDVGESAGVHFAVTELLEGETLRDLLSRGPMPVRRALDVALQIAEGLAAAHEKGIVHRDVKPENVYLTKAGHAKLLDFGLARHRAFLSDPGDTHSPTEAILTERGAVFGTVAYMSPEQARGETVDFRSDQFSLGIVLYEMLTGTRPFTAGSAAQTMAAIIEREPEPLSARAPRTPDSVESLVERCLSKRQEERYSSSRDLAHDLRSAWLQSSGISGEPHGTLPLRPRRRVMLASLAAAALVLVAAALWRWPRERDRGASATSVASAVDDRRVIVANFENRTGDVSLDRVGQMAADWISAGLNELRIDVVPRAEFAERQDTKPPSGGQPAKTASGALAERTGAGIVVTGAYYLTGESLQLHTQIWEARGGKPLGTVEPARAPKGDPMPAIDLMRQRVRDVVGLRLGATAEDLGASEPRAPRYEAYREYLAASEAQEGTTLREAQLLKALEIDPDFVAPRLRLARHYFRVVRLDEASAQLEFLEKRIERLTRVQRLMVERDRALLNGRRDVQLARSREIVALMQGDLVERVTLGEAALMANRPKEAIDILSAPVPWERLLRTEQPDGMGYFRSICLAYHEIANHKAELATVRRGQQIYPGQLQDLEIRAVVALGRHEEVERILRESRQQAGASRTVGWLLLEASRELRAHGRRPESLEMAARSVSWFRALGRSDLAAAAGSPRTYLANSLLQAERWGELATLAAELEKELPTNYPSFTGLRAIAALHLGDRATVDQIDEELRRADGPNLREFFYCRAVLAAQKGEKDLAVGLLTEAIGRGWPAYARFGFGFWFHREAVLEPLHGYPPYDELVRPKG